MVLKSLAMAACAFPSRKAPAPTIVSIKGKGFWPFHYALLNGKDLETIFVSRRGLQATITPDAIREPGIYLVTVKSRGEPIAQSNPAPFVVSFTMQKRAHPSRRREIRGAPK